MKWIHVLPNILRGRRRDLLQLHRKHLRTPACFHLTSHLQFAPSVELLQFPLGGVHVGEASGLAQHPGVLQGLADPESLVWVEDDQLTDLQSERGQEAVTEVQPDLPSETGTDEESCDSGHVGPPQRL